MISSKKSLIIIILIFYNYSEHFCHADFVIVTNTTIDFFSNGTVNTSMNVGLKSLTAAAFDHMKKDIYVCEFHEKLYRIKSNGKKEYKANELIYAEQEGVVIGIAFDHDHSKLYWRTCHGIFFVDVPDYDITVQLNRQVFFLFYVEYPPAGLAINVHREYVYWVKSNNITNTTTIEGSSLDRSERKEFVKDLSIPSKITVDVDGNTLYWIDWENIHDFSIGSFDLRGNGTKNTLIHAAEKRIPKVIAVDDHSMYWIEGVSYDLWVMSKGSSNTPMLLKSNMKLADQPIGLFVLSGGDGSKDDENKFNGSVTSDGSMTSRFLNHSDYRTNHNHN